MLGSSSIVASFVAGGIYSVQVHSLRMYNFLARYGANPTVMNPASAVSACHYGVILGRAGVAVVLIADGSVSGLKEGSLYLIGTHLPFRIGFRPNSTNVFPIVEDMSV